MNNKHILKSNKRYNRQSHHNTDSPQKRHKGYISFLALDSCTLIDMANVIAGKMPEKKDKSYVNFLKVLLSNNAINPDGSRRFGGRFVLGILPQVKKELENKYGLLPAHLQELFYNHYFFDIEINKTSKDIFKKLEKALTKEYVNKKLFLEKDRLLYQKIKNETDHNNLVKMNDKFIPSSDALIVAQASILNWTLISRDKDIVFNRDDWQGLHKVKEINKKIVGIFTEPAEPRRIENFFSLQSSGWNPPPIMNSHMLSFQNQDILQKILKINPHKNKELY